MNILIRSKDGSQEVFGGITHIEVIDTPKQSRNRIKVIDSNNNAEQFLDLNDDRVELLPENDAL